MVFNAEKSAHLSVHCNYPSSTSDQITMKGVLIPQVKTHKHLGLTINNALKWTDHINNTHSTCARQVGILRRLRKKLDPSVIKRIYTGAIRPKMEYACAIWSGGTTTKLVELHILPTTQHRPPNFTTKISLFHLTPFIENSLESNTEALT